MFRALFLGLCVFIVVIILRTGQARQGAVIHNDLSLLLLIPFFLFLSLMAHALSRVVFIRKSHPTGLQGSIVAQERAIILLIGLLGLAFLLFAVLIGGTTNSVLFTNLEHVLAVVGVMYNWLVGIIAAIIIIIVIPIFWLLSFITSICSVAKSKQISSTAIFSQSSYKYIAGSVCSCNYSNSQYRFTHTFRSAYGASYSLDSASTATSA